MIKQFIGKPYETDEKKEEILSLYDEYQIRKLEFLNESYHTESTMTSYWTLYMSNLHYDEVNKGKDLMDFSTEELKILLASCYGIDTTKASMGSFLSMYCRWASSDKKRLININPYTSIKMSKIKKNSKRFLEQRIYGQDMFFDLCEKMIEKTKLPNVIPFILARYGVAGERLHHMRHLKWTDIDDVNMQVHVKTDDGLKVLSSLPIDAKFLEWIKKAKLYSESISDEDGTGKNIVRYEDYGYVLKKAMVDKNDTETVNKYNTVYNRGNSACSSIGIKRIAFKDLIRTRQLELLLQKRKRRRLDTSDFKEMIELFSLDEEFRTDNRAYTLKKRYEELTGDIVTSERKEHSFPANENHFGTAIKLIQDLGLEIEE